jgi:hypothetical protein
MAKATRTLRYLVALRANGRCEYCRRYQVMIGETFFEVEHILPRALGGSTHPANLAFACRRCNLLKSDKMTALDPRTERLAPLFNPRRDRWSDHFRRSQDQIRIFGRTARGRATVELLQFNEPSEQQVRRIQRDYLASVFPLD